MRITYIMEGILIGIGECSDYFVNLTYIFSFFAMKNYIQFFIDSNRIEAGFPLQMTLQFDFPVDTAKELRHFSCGFKFFAANFALDALLYSLYFFFQSWSEEANQDHTSCMILVICMNYFYLTNFFWMLVEGTYIHYRDIHTKSII